MQRENYREIVEKVGEEKRARWQGSEREKWRARRLEGDWPESIGEAAMLIISMPLR